MSDYLLNLTNHETKRSRETLNFIASENYPSPKILDLMGSVWMNKYAEGYPGKRYYAGNQYTDELELYTQKLALQVFDSTGEYAVNVQILSGSPANTTVFLSCLNPGDRILSLGLAEGGHLSHLHQTHPLKKIYNHETYELKASNEGFELDLVTFEQKIQTFQPRLVIIGFSAYPKAFDFEKFIECAHKYGALVLADIAHISGLVAAGFHSSPFGTGVKGADFITTTTHKTLRGPRGALVFAKQGLIGDLNKTVFPGLNGGPHLQQIAATAQCLEEILGLDVYPNNLTFQDYIQAVLENTKHLENGLASGGLEIVTPTQTHLTLIRLPEEMDSLLMQENLEMVGIITNRNSLPLERKSPWRPSGMRFGAAALTSRGMQGGEFEEAGSLIAQYIFDPSKQTKLKQFVAEMTSKLAWYYI